MPNKPTTYPAQAFFFPAATLHALIVIPLAVLANTGIIQSWGLVASGHAQEMLAGFALALVAGYTLGSITLARGLFLLGIWFSARFLTLTGLSPLLASLCSLLFGIMLALEVLPRYRAARRWRNLAQLPLLGAIALLPGAWALLREMPIAVAELNILAETAGILLLTLLMLFMAGRLIAPAAAGDFYDRGTNLKNRVQPNLEGALLILIPIAISLFLLTAEKIAGVVLVSAGGVALTRLLRWRLWLCKGRIDLYGLGVGYAWLALGLMVTGVSMLVNHYQPAWLHMMTIGALGILSTGIMSRWYFYYFQRILPKPWYIQLTVTAISVAVVARLAVIELPEHYTHLLWLSVAAWEVAYAAALFLAIDGLRRRKDRPQRDTRITRPHAQHAESETIPS